MVLVIRNREGAASLPPFHVKDHDEREIPLPRHTLKLTKDWLNERRDGFPFILLTPERYRWVLKRWCEHQASRKPWLNKYMINNVIRDIRSHVKRAGVELDGAVTVHCFRKSCGQNWANHLPMNVVKEFMGHASISTTAEFYSTVTDDHTAQARWVAEALMAGTGNATDAEVTPGPKNHSNRRAG